MLEISAVVLVLIQVMIIFSCVSNYFHLYCVVHKVLMSNNLQQYFSTLITLHKNEELLIYHIKGEHDVDEYGNVHYPVRTLHIPSH